MTWVRLYPGSWLLPEMYSSSVLISNTILDPGYKSLSKDYQPWAVQIFGKGTV